jgi:hypothetical protein
MKSSLNVQGVPCKVSKPILMAEFGSLAVGGNPNGMVSKSAADFPTRFPAVKGLIFFPQLK